MEIAEIAKIAKQQIYECRKCNYITSNRYDYNKHVQTIKHSQEINIDDNSICMETKKSQKKFICPNCEKVYKDNSGLWKHKKICKEIQSTDLNSNTSNLSSQITPELILTVLEQNKELTNLVVEQNKTIIELAKTGQSKTIISNNSNINSNNKTFNLQFFLVTSIGITLSPLH